jgi:hypothetical protein
VLRCTSLSTLFLFFYCLIQRERALKVNMVVLASAITTKTGKCLLSRQFVEMSKVRIEGLLAAFPKLMGSEKQHTFIETDAVSFV